MLVERRTSAALLFLVMALIASLLAPPGAAAAQGDWSNADIGSVSPPGSFRASSALTIAGSGTGLTGQRDGLHFAWQDVSGVAVVTAQLRSLSNAHGAAHAGVMLRSSLDANAPHVALVFESNQVVLRSRAAADATTTGVPHRLRKNDSWVRLTRQGTSVIAEVSHNARGWQHVGSVSIELGETVHAGLAVSSGVDGVIASAEFDGVSVEGDEPSRSVPTPEPNSEPEPTVEPQPTPEPEPTTEPQPTTEPDPQPVEAVRINTGGAALTDWGADTGTAPSQHVTFSQNRTEAASPVSKGSTVPASVPLSLFESMRWVSGSSGNYLRYALPHDGGSQTLRLFFIERAHTAPGMRLFNVDVDGQRVLTDFDVFAAAGAAHTGLMKQWTRSYTSAGTMTVEITGSGVDAPVLSGLELTAEPAPDPTTEPTTETAPAPAPAPAPVPSVDRLGLHVTAQELDVWRDRWASGVPGDSFLNTRVTDERNRVTTNRNTFVSNPNNHLWVVDGILPLDSNGCRIPGSSSSNFGSERTKAAIVRDAAFHALLTRDASAMRQVGSVLVAQTKRSDVAFANTSQWCPMISAMKDSASPGFVLSHLVTNHLYAYDYFRIAVNQGIVSELSSADRDAIRRWHLGFAGFIEPSNTWRANLPFVNRLAGNYTLTSTYADPNNLWSNPRTYTGGPSIHRGHNLFNNRDASLARFIALAGITYDHATYKDRARRWLLDWNRYHVLPNGSTGDQHRGSSSASTGTAYMALGAAHVLTGIDAFARTGDTSLYDHAPTDGMHDSVGAPHHGTTRGKSFLFVVQTMARYGNGTFNRTNSAGQRFDLRTPSNLGLHDRFIPANIYYRDTGLSRDFYRGTNGQPTWTRPPSNNDLNDTWSLPAPYLMWAGLESHIWPYPTN